MQEHQPAEVAGRFVRHEDATAGDPLQMPLSGVKRDAEGVVEVGVGDEDLGHADGHVGTAPDVENHAELANPKICFMTGTRAAFDGEVLGRDREEILVH